MNPTFSTLGDYILFIMGIRTSKFYRSYTFTNTYYYPDQLSSFVGESNTLPYYSHYSEQPTTLDSIGKYESMNPSMKKATYSGLLSTNSLVVILPRTLSINGTLTPSLYRFPLE
jgi:hypothetical protein